MPVSISVCAVAPARLGEGPRWDAGRGELVWLDILEGRIHRAPVGADGELGPVETIQLDRHVGAVAPAEDGGYVAAAGQGFLRVAPDGTVTELAQPEAGRTDVRMNDGVCDPQGRFWAGTMAYDETPGAGVLYRLEPDGTATAVLRDLTISNGIGFSPDGTTMYLADSGAGRIDAFAFDGPGGGALSARRTIYERAPDHGWPDGLTVDDEGCLWVAFWDGGAVRRLSPDGELLQTVELPVERLSACAFGGPDRATLFVTSAFVGLDEATRAAQRDAGRLLRVDGLGVTGPPARPWRATASRAS